MPTGYIIRSYNCSSHIHLRSLKIEGSSDLESWEILDSLTNKDILNGANRPLIPCFKEQRKATQIRANNGDWFKLVWK